MRDKSKKIKTQKSAVYKKNLFFNTVDNWGIILFFVALAARLIFAWGSLKNPLFAQHDDAYYYYKIAWNIVHGNGICFTPGIPTNGFHPLWLIILLPIYAIVPKNNLYLPIHIANTITAFATTLAIYIIYRMLRERYPDVKPGLIAILLGLFSIHPNIIYYQMCGMETGFALLPFAIAIYTHWKLLQRGENYGKYFKWWVVANIVLLWTRIDYATIVWILNIHLLWRWRSKKLIPYLALINVSILPWILWCKLKFGYWVPISGLAFPYIRRQYFLWINGNCLYKTIFYLIEIFRIEFIPSAFGVYGGMLGLIFLLGVSGFWFIFKKNK